MKKTSLVLSAVTGLAAATFAMISPAAAVAAGGSEIMVPLNRCFEIDPVAGTSHEMDRSPVKPLAPSWCP